jgi:pimeloyl-ACP methyl ester carboxylesterase
VLANGTPKRPLETLLGGNFLAPAFDWLTQLERAKPDWVKLLWKVQENLPATEKMLGNLGFNKHLTDPEDIKTYAKQILELHPAVLTEMMNDYQHFDATPWLHEIKHEALILSGSNDLITPPKTQDILAQLMPNSKLVRIRHGSHCSTLDLPEYINLLIENFVK